MKTKKRKQRTKESIAHSLEQQIALKMEKKLFFTAANYKKAKNSLCRYLGEEANTWTLDDLTNEVVSEYIRHMESRGGLCDNTISFYGRTLRAMYNHSLEHLPECEKEKSPFIGIHLKNTDTLKRTLSKEEMNALIEFDLSREPHLAKTRDLFLFLFLTCGMCFVDVYSLQKQNISGGYVNYVRSKTKMPLRIKINPEIQVLLDRYREADSPYLFPFLHEQQSGLQKPLSEPSSLRRVNRHLNKLGELLKFELPLTTYCARHSWASLSEAAGIGIAIISQALGHTSERITRTYMKGLPSHVVDEANEKMLNLMIRMQRKKEKGKKRPALCKNKTTACDCSFKP